MTSKTLKVSSVNHYHVKQESLAYQVTCQSRKPLEFIHWTTKKPRVYTLDDKEILRIWNLEVEGNRELIRLYEAKFE